MSSTSGQTDRSSSLEDLGKAIDRLQANKVTMAGTPGVFVAKDVLQQTVKILNSVLHNPNVDTKDPRVVEYAATIGQLREDHAKALGQIKEKEDEVAKSTQQLTLLRDQLSTANKAVASASKGTSSESAEMKRKLADLELQLGKAKIASKGAQRGYDPDALEQALATETKLKQEVQTLTAMRKEHDAAVTSANAAIAKLKADIAEKDKVLTESRKQVGQLKSAAAIATANKSVPKVDVEINVPLVKSLFGNKTLKWLSDIDHQRRTNLRDYGHQLLNAANSSSANRHLGDLIKLAIDWMSTKVYAAREAIRPWLMMIEADLRSGIVKTIAFYRDQLKIIIGDYKMAKEHKLKTNPEQTRVRTETESIVSALVKRAVAAKERVSLWARAKKVATKAAIKVKAFFKGLTQFFSPKANPNDDMDEKIFDQDDYIVMTDEEQPAASRLSKVDKGKSKV